MNAQCPREDELLDAMGRGYVGAELTAHIADCVSCRDLHLVAGALLGDRSQAVAEAAVPSSGTMLWRMQMRHRHEAEATTRRSLLIGQAATLLVAITLVISFFGPAVAVEVREIAAALRLSTPILLALAAWVLLAPIGGYIALRQK